MLRLTRQQASRRKELAHFGLMMTGLARNLLLTGSVPVWQNLGSGLRHATHEWP